MDLLGIASNGQNIMAMAGQESSQVELWDITSARKIMSLPQTCSANMADHPTKQRGFQERVGGKKKLGDSIKSRISATRIAKVGTASRPLLDQPSSDPYTMAFSKLSTLAEQRGDAYANNDVRVSLEEIASKQGHDDVSKLTPTDIAIESLHKIENFVIKHTVVDNTVDDSQIQRIQTL